MNREAFVAECRSYLGTPFQHQGRLPGIGLDCAGVLACAGAACGAAVVKDDTGYGQRPDEAYLQACLKASGLRQIPARKAQVGDILLMRYDLNAQHLAVLTCRDPMTILHAVTGRQVIEHRLDNAWKSRILTALTWDFDA